MALKGGVMSDQALVSVAAETVAEAPVKKLTQCVSPTHCQEAFFEGGGYVPSFDFMEKALFGGSGTLTREQVLTFEVCAKCAKVLPDRGVGRVYSSFGALRQLEAVKVEREKRRILLQVEREKRKAVEERLAFARRLYGSKRPPCERSFVNYVPPPAREYVNATLAEGGAPYEPHGRGHKPQKVSDTFRDPNAPKKYGDEKKFVAAAHEKKKRKKKGADDEVGGLQKTAKGRRGR